VNAFVVVGFSSESDAITSPVLWVVILIFMLRFENLYHLRFLLEVVIC
jgi:hypothetical protein